MDQLSSEAVLDHFDTRLATLTTALRSAAPAIVALGSAMAATWTGGGRIFYIGAGTSGRLGVLDAAEWPPTFGVAEERVVGLIAGGTVALWRAVEGAEDSIEEAPAALGELELTSKDLVCGITASGRTPYVLSGLEYAAGVGCRRALITSGEPRSSDSQLILIQLATGGELLAGSTRLLAASAAHQVLQRASNLCAIELGWVYGGRMVEMRPTNVKLVARAEKIVADLGEVELDRAAQLLDEAKHDIKVAIVMARRSASLGEAQEMLTGVARRLDRVLGPATRESVGDGTESTSGGS